MFSNETLLWPVSGTELLRRQGSMWSLLAEDQKQLGTLAEIRALAMRSVLDRKRSLATRHLIDSTSDFVYEARARVTLRQVSKSPAVYSTPAGVIDFGSFYSRKYFEAGRDYRIDGDRVIFFDSVDLGERPRVYARGVYRYVGDLTNFWCRLLQLPTPERSWDRCLNASYRGIVKQTSELSLRDVIAAVFEVPVIRHPAKVIQVHTDRPRPLVVTDRETLVGHDGDSPSVEVGQLVAPGDFVFESVRFHDFCLSKPPSWMSVLRVPPRYFPKGISHPIQFSNQPQTLTSSIVGGKIRVRFPITAASNAERDRFWELVDEREEALGHGLAQFITNHPSPTLGQLPSQVIPLQVIWSLWLNLGVSVSVVRLRPTTDHLGRLALIRRLVPPWLTHFIHFDQTEPQPYDRFC